MSTRFEKMMRIPNALLRVLGLGVCTWRCVHKYPKLFKCSKENEVSICDPCMEDMCGEDPWDPLDGYEDWEEEAYLNEELIFDAKVPYCPDPLELKKEANGSDEEIPF